MEAAGGAEGARYPHRIVEMLDVPFLPFCLLLGLLGFVCVAFVSSWCQYWRGGFAWDGSARMFNWHPVLMVTAMVVLYGAASLVYRLPASWSGPKLPWKVLHSSLALAALALAALGLVAVFRFHNEHGTPNMYSLHSWLGMATILLFSCQWLAGFSTFLLPWAPSWLRGLYKPVHIFFGSTILLLAVASCVSGINEKLFFSLTGQRSTSSCLLRPSLPTPWGSSSCSLGCWCWVPWPGRAGSALMLTARTPVSHCSPLSVDADGAAKVSPCPSWALWIPSLPCLLCWSNRGLFSAIPELWKPITSLPALLEQPRSIPALPELWIHRFPAYSAGAAEVFPCHSRDPSTEI
ncbi:lysosomal membrane ascorbate-dependent ferrireductase CYB561A3 [Pezoporus occidentalis]|uniref:lysosomal membrane ascorbate-dependent ferrireductase CYB561A3 n=1 Tax=Pezoporus occidentalis TaxID=407982 RepID=UPI002F9086EB